MVHPSTNFLWITDTRGQSVIVRSSGRRPGRPQGTAAQVRGAVAVTLTLPLDVIAALGAVDADLVGATTVAEGANGTTSWTPDQDLQPTTVFYWRARARQGTAVSAWSATGTFKSKLVGFNRAGELYDPLITARRSARSSAPPPSFRAAAFS